MLLDTRLPIHRAVGLLIAFGILSTLSACTQAETATSPRAAAASPKIGYVTLRPQPVAIQSDTAGRVVALRTAEIRPQVGGVVMERVFEPGCEVKQGDLLFRLDPKPFEAQLAAAEATLAKASAALPSVQAKAERYANLSASTVISQQDKEDAQALFLQTKADIAAAEAAVETARINLGYAEIRAPIDGIIGTTNVDIGTLLTAGQAASLATIRQLDPIYVDLTESSSNLLRRQAALEEGAFVSAFGNAAASPQVTLKLPGGTIYGETGTLEARDRFVSESTSTFTVRARFPNPDLTLLPGQYVRASIEIGSDDEGFLVPQRAVSRNSKGEATASFLTGDDMIETRIIETYTDVGGEWLVTGGVAEGDRLVVDGFQKIQPGARVSPVEVELDGNGVVRTPDAAGSTALLETSSPGLASALVAKAQD
ncbi:efflux RND transporter periplasmic adaptor subunit [Antarcticirhabdus aurantiaca]|uniref:Efflux RND transporter periplasmic adaptor subunit n=1 Tax=Antarcticirhabdus aurantiaca TaxID=2606717 RepID=A0ACD4NNR0_9HYPH|nr:efflux RND transporter periplasmic adaptor subunit [Antarcticirhabdus aurantiaca]WAJ28336.1 efflux RND transporter periplasmic adaptor subunit [Jeongeuplla avenae]